MPMGDLRRALRVDNPSQHGPHLFAQPTIYTWEAVRTRRRWGRRKLASTWEVSNTSGPPMIRGGIHLTAPAFLPASILKEMTATEEQFYQGKVNFEYLLSAGLEDLRLEQHRLQTFFYKGVWKISDNFGNRIKIKFLGDLKPISDDLSEAADIKPTLPWFLDCNRERFPYWFRKEEPRNQIIHEKLTLFSAKHGLRHRRLCHQLFEGATVSCFVNNSQLAVPHHFAFI